jgi:hypothetical protein
MVELITDTMHLDILEVIKLSVYLQWVLTIRLKFSVGVLQVEQVDKVEILAALVDMLINPLP